MELRKWHQRKSLTTLDCASLGLMICSRKPFMHQTAVRKIITRYVQYESKLPCLLRGMSLAPLVSQNLKEVYIMAGKNTAAFGIYPNQMALEEGLMALREANFRHED